MEQHTTKALERAAAAVNQAKAIMITAGAGMGVDSGLPDFRGNQGFWRAYPAFQRLGLSFFDMANPGWFERDSEVAWGFYGHRLNLYRSTTPHAGFELLRRWAEHLEHGYFVFTSNVDGHFQRAGFAPDRVAECHGSIHHMQCSVPCNDQIWAADGVRVAVDETSFRAARPLPECPACGRVARPNILMFGDWSWLAARSAGQERGLARWLGELDSGLVIVEIGAGTAVPTVRITSERAAARTGATLIRINPREPQVPPPHVGIALPAREALETIEQMRHA